MNGGTNSLTSNLFPHFVSFEMSKLTIQTFSLKDFNGFLILTPSFFNKHIKVKILNCFKANRKRMDIFIVDLNP